MRYIKNLAATAFVLVVAIAASAQSPGLQWFGVLDGDNTKFFNQVAVDANGNVYTAGGFYGTADADLTDAGEHLITSFDQSDGFLIKQKPNGTFDKVLLFQGAGYQAVNTVNVDGNGDVIISGSFENTVDFDPDNAGGEFTTATSATFLIKISATGAVTWIKIFDNATGYAGIWTVAIDQSNNIFLGGQFMGTIDADPGSSTFNLVSAAAGSSDLWFAKLAANGNFTSAVRVGDTGEDMITSMAMDSNNQLIAVGDFAGTVDFDPGTGSAPLTSNGASDTYMLKLNNSLGYVWAKQIIQSQLYIGGIDTDATNNIIFNGTLYGTADFDPGTGILNLIGTNGDMFIASYNSSGNVNWAKSAGSLGTEEGNALTIDNSGNIFVAGRFTQTFDINPDGGEEKITFQPDGYDLYLARFSNAGDLLWYKSIPSGDIISAVDMQVDNDNNIYMIGDWNEEVDFTFDTCLDGARVSYDNAVYYILKMTPEADIACFGFLEQPTSEVIACVGQEVTVSAPAGGTSHITYQWQLFDGVWKDLVDQEVDGDNTENGYEGTDTPYLKIVATEGGEQGDLRVMVNGDGVTTIYSNTVNFINHAAPAVPGLVATSGCGPAYYNIQAFSPTFAEYNWYVDDLLVDDVTLDNLSLFLNTNTDVAVEAVIDGCSGAKSLIVVNTQECVQPPGVTWVQQLGPGFNHPNAMKLDTDNNVYIVGEFSNAIDFDPGVGDATLTPENDNANFIAKYSPTGALLWVRQTQLEIMDIDVGTAGDDLYYVGHFQGTIDLDPGAGVASFVAAGTSRDIAIVELAGDGLFQWAKQIAGSSNESGNFGRAITHGPSDEIVITGTFTQTMDFDPGAGSAPLTSASAAGFDIFVAKYDDDGNYLWAKRMGSTAFQEYGYDVEVDAAGHVYTIGKFQTTVDFDPTAGAGNIVNLVSAGATDAFIQSLNSDGTFRWAKRIGSLGADEAVTFDLDHLDNLIITGHFIGTVDFDPDGGVFNMTGSSGTSFILKLTNAGTFDWVKEINGDVTKVFVDPTDKILLTGTYDHAADLDPTIGNYTLETAVTSDIFVAHLDAAGDFIWTYNTNGSGREYFQNESAGIAMDSDGDIILTGEFTNMIDMDPTHCTYALATMGGMGSRETFIQKITPDVATICFGLQPQNVAACDVLEVHLLAEATGTTNLSYTWQKLNTTFGYFENVTGPEFTGINSSELIFNGTSTFGSGTYRVSVTGDLAGTSTSNAAEVLISTMPDPLTYTPTSFCSPGEKHVEVSGDADGYYKWYDANMNVIDGAVDHDFTTPFIDQTTTFYATFTDGGCETPAVQVDVEINITTNAPDVIGAVSCSSPASVTLQASGGGVDGYLWYENPQDVDAIADSYTDTYETPVLSTTTSYYVSIVDGACESLRTEVTAEIGGISPPVSSDATTCTNTSAALSASISGGITGELRWYAAVSDGSPLHVGSTFDTPLLSANTTYYVSTFTADCESSRTSVTVTVNTCTGNQPPVIATASPSIQVGGILTVDLGPLLSDPDNNLDLTTLKIFTQPKSGAFASIVDGQLVIDYSGTAFAGDDEVTIEVCDLSGLCVQQTITIRVEGDMVVYNAVSPNGDGKNDVFFIGFIDAFEATKNNHMKIYNRWGDLVFDVENYNNTTNVFAGKNKNGNDLPSGTYFYKIEFTDGRKTETGYLSLKR